VLWHLGKVEFEIDESILSEEVDLRIVLRVELLKAIDGLGYLELVNFEEFNGLVFLFVDQLCFSNDVFFMWQELFNYFAGFLEQLLFGLFDLNLDGFDCFRLLLGRLRSLFFTHGL